MSLFCGILGNLNVAEKEKFDVLLSNFVSFKIPNGYVWIRQTDPNIYYNKDENKGFVLSGIGLENTANGFKKLNNNTWGKYLYNPYSVSFPDGHYCGVSWINNKVFLFNDVLGIKHIYVKYTKDKVYFSNNINLLLKFIGDVKLNLNEFFAAWFLNPTVSFNPIIEDVKRLNGITEFLGNRLISNTEHEWIPNFNVKLTVADFDNVLSKLIDFTISEYSSVSLGLTAGLDSRLLLSYFLAKKSNFNTHTFGDNNLPDVIYSKKISESLNFNHLILDYEIPNKNNLIDTLINYISYTNITLPISETIQFGMHKTIAKNNDVIVDGSYGETYRRQMLNKLLIAGKSALINKDYSKISQFIKSSRPNIFNTELESQILESVTNSVSQIFVNSPNPNYTRWENWLDVFAIKTKMPNTTAYSQHYLDTICNSISIFLQPTIVKVGLSIDIEDRINGKMFRSIIKNNFTKLTKFSLVKNNYAYPYLFGNKASFIYTKIKSKLFKKYTWHLNETILDINKDYIWDSLNENNNYNNLVNINFIKSAFKNYYNSNKKDKQILEWYLTFNLFIKSITNPIL